MYNKKTNICKKMITFHIINFLLVGYIYITYIYISKHDCEKNN